ncbi:MAG: hypothetical protein V4773_22040 [Verrucomicrobiota bacterium]
MKWRRTKRLNSVLGLSLSHGQLRAFHVARTKGGVEVVKAASATLTLDLLHPEADLIGREIKNHLEAAGIRERNCVVAVPAGWVMTQHTAVPELSPEDASSLLEMEAEKGFPCDPSQLQIARSPHRAGKSEYMTQLAVRREQVSHLATALRSAGLKPLSFSLGLPSLPGVIAAPGAGRITLRLEPTGATLLVSVGGGIAAFRTFDATIDSEAGETLVNGRAIAREVRITFEQVPADLRREVQTLFLTGDDKMTRQLGEILADWARDNGLTLERDMTTGRPIADQVAEQLATRCLTHGMFNLEFLPPRASRWMQLMARYNSKRLATAGFAAGAIALLALLAFGWQEYERMSLRNEWETMRTEVMALEGVQNKIREYRPFYDVGYRNLTILKRVTECFPESGTVTAKSLEIRGTSLVSISGTARDNAALLRTLDEVRKVREVQNLKIEQIRGKAPAQQFTFTFRWNSSPTP